MTDAIDPGDLPLTFAEAARHPALTGGGKAKCLETVIRKMERGVTGVSGQKVRLGFVLTGSGRRTTSNLLWKFYRELNALAPTSTTPAVTHASHTEAEQHLDALGLG